MDFVMQRNFTVKGFGHSIGFKKGEATHVPPILHSEARKWGAIPTDGEDAVVEEEQETKFPTPASEPQGDERESMLLDACDALVGRNGTNDFGANGAPKVTAMFDLVGFRIDANERNAIWELYNKRKQEALNPSNTDSTVTPPDVDAVDNTVT